MSRQTKLMGVLLSAVILAGLAAVGTWFLRHTEPEVCAVCQRPIHARAGAIAEIGNKRVSTCCARCYPTSGRRTSW